MRPIKAVLNYAQKPHINQLVLLVSEVYNEKLDLTGYKENDQWQLLQPALVKPENLSAAAPLKQIVVELKLKRRHLFYTIFLTCPTIILYLISGLTFLLPAESGEKVSFAVTILLAQIVLFGNLSNIFPASSKNLPILAYFVLTVTIHMSLACVAAVLGKF